MKKTKPSSSWIIKKGKTHVKYNKPSNFNNRYRSEIRKRITTTDGNRVPLIYRFLNKKKKSCNWNNPPETEWKYQDQHNAPKKSTKAIKQDRPFPVLSEFPFLGVYRKEKYERVVALGETLEII